MLPLALSNGLFLSSFHPLPLEFAHGPWQSCDLDLGHKYPPAHT